MTFFIITILFLSLLYMGLIFFFFQGWNKTELFNPDENESLCEISFIIAFRNEALHLHDLIHDLILQDYDKKKLEIIMINDHSEDESVKIIEHYQSLHPSISLFHLQNYTGKKAAIQLGVEKASADLVVTTDADCRLSPQWLSTIARFYILHQPAMIIAPVQLTGNTTFQHFQALEFISLIASGAGAAAQGTAIMNNGANLAFERKEFLKLKDAQNKAFASGDDVFLLQELKSQNKKICFLKSQQAIVKTSACQNFIDFFYQRIRWASKGPGYRDFNIIFSAGIIFFYNLLFIISFVLGCIKPLYFGGFILLFFLKSFPDFLLLRSACRFFNRNELMRFFLPLQFIYPVYVVLIAALARLLTFKWKGRKYNQ